MPNSDADITRRDDRRGRGDRRSSRSKSRSTRKRSRSRSRSVDRHRQRRSRRSRSRSGSRYSKHHKSSRRNVDSRSRSRSRSSHRSYYKNSRSRYSTSRSPRPLDGRYENRKSCSRSSERYFKIKDNKDDKDLPTQFNSESCKSINDGDNSSTQNLSCNTDANSLVDLPLPDQAESNSGNYENFDDSQEPIDKERIHREMEEKLRLALAKEGKVYPPPKPEASHPVFANDGSFLEIFKKMQEAQQSMSGASTTAASVYGVALPSAPIAAQFPTTSAGAKTVPQPPLVGRRRGGKILKTGLVAKPKAINNTGDDKDFWSIYLAEVNKYKNNACELNLGNRPLLK